MNWFKNLFSKQEEPIEVPVPVVEQVVTVTNQVKSTWRNNMWVVTDKGLGITFQIGEPTLVHLVDEKGTTVGSALFPFNSLRQALYTEIPASRRGDAEIARKLGYM